MLATPHDIFFKALFSHPRRAAEVLRAVLPSQVARRIDWSTLVHVRGSFIDDKLRNSHADLLFSAVMAGRTIKIYVLFEHQSTYDPTMGRRLLRYMDRIWDVVAEPGASELPVIIPVVLYHGEKPWSGTTDFHGMFTLPPECAPFVPQFRFVLVDLAALDPAVIHAWTASACVRLALLVLQSARSPTRLDEVLLGLRNLILRVMAEPFEDGALRQIIRYILETRGAEEFDRAVDLMTDIEKDQAGGTMETIAQMLRREGRVEGRVEGRRNTLLEVIQLRHGEVPATLRAQIETANEAELQMWLARVVRSSTLVELLTPG